MSITRDLKMLRKQCISPPAQTVEQTFQLALGTRPESATANGLSGTVTYESGGVLAGVQILVENESTGAARTAYSDSRGQYSVPNLPAGSYRVTATRPGFETLVRPGIALSAGRPVTAELTLKIGRVGTEVKVNASLSSVPTEAPSGQIEYEVNQEDYTNTQAFSVSNIFALSPGVTTQQGNGPRDISISIRGSNAQQTYGVRNLQMSDDGFPVTQPDGLGRTDINDPHAYDAVDIVEGPSSALYGNYATGGYINYHQRQVEGIEAGSDFGSYGYENDYVSMGSTGQQYTWTAFLSNVRGSQYTDHTSYDTFTADILASYSLTPKDRITLKFLNNDLTTQLSIRLSLNQYETNPWQKGCAFLAAAGCASVSLYQNGFNGAKVSESADQAGLGRHDRRTIRGRAVGSRFHRKHYPEHVVRLG
jgi:iron complex outermembrane recepter protein